MNSRLWRHDSQDSQHTYSSSLPPSNQHFLIAPSAERCASAGFLADSKPSTVHLAAPHPALADLDGRTTRVLAAGHGGLQRRSDDRAVVGFKDEGLRIEVKGQAQQCAFDNRKVLTCLDTEN